MGKRIEVPSTRLNLSPEAFHLWATHYLKCKRDFHSPDKFSPVPYFLLCRAIELELKARLLKNSSQENVKRDYGHHLEKAYDALDQNERNLTQEEECTMQLADDIYNNNKSFEYFNPN